MKFNFIFYVVEVQRIKLIYPLFYYAVNNFSYLHLKCV